MNNVIQIRKDCVHDNCYICKTSLVKNYNHGVAIIKNDTGAHFICKQCFVQLFVRPEIEKNIKKCHTV